MLNWRELAETEQAGIEIGAHTCKHPQLDQLPRELDTGRALRQQERCSRTTWG